ncbi:MAG: hypothetical protein ACFFFB_12385 [Candidatus Heimdallarchaeota archaeon]
MNYLDRNYHLIEERMIQQMKNSIILGRKLIDTELDTGLLNFIVKPLVKTFYDYWSNNDVKEGTLKQIKVTLDSGKRLVMNGDSEQNFNKIIEEAFPKYLEADQTSRNCSHSHKNYNKIKNVAKETFINYLKEVVKLLEVQEDVEDYGDLCRVAFQTKEVAEQNLIKQLEFTNKGIEIVEDDPSILKIPVGKRIIVKTLRRGFERTKADFLKSLNETYEQK